MRKDKWTQTTVGHKSSCQLDGFNTSVSIHICHNLPSYVPYRYVWFAMLTQPL